MPARIALLFWGETAMIAGGCVMQWGAIRLGVSVNDRAQRTAAGENSRSKRSASSKLLNAISNPMLL
jgi:hypothetical protein